ncbi:MAG: helicase-related protein, partial [Acidimicrobiaceae bacterium]|nr:helicase-related protein [Acidimicrobiaceae bacterium]
DRMDRKDILELFDYQTAYEVTLQDAIERGYLVPYTYYGLTDNIDYSKIRFQNQRYRVDDLERHLIIPERNQAILNEYIDKGSRDKAIGFCVSIKHADRMAKFFSENGVPAAAIHSESPNRDQLIQDFRENRINVAFTVDLFNEGVDFPNVQVIMFLRPTESRTVFLQQLGRGLRLTLGKKRLRILDFIGNYKRANQIRSYLSKNKQETSEQDADGRTRRKFEFEYSTGCEVVFDPEVEEILANQDAEDLGIGEIELTEAYYSLAEQLGRKPTRQDVDDQGEYSSARYAAEFGSWIKFIRKIGEYTEASYHYPQGTHVGHILSILWYFGLPDRTGTPFDAEYIRMRGDLGEGRLSTYRRQIKYKLQAAMELKILEDDRRAQSSDSFEPSLTPFGQELRRVLYTRLTELDLDFPRGEGGVPSTKMNQNGRNYNGFILTALSEDADAARVIRQAVFGMHAVQQMLLFLYQNCVNGPTTREFIYANFFDSPPVLQFTEREGIEPATMAASRRRCPFLLNLLAATGIIRQDANHITLQQFVLFPQIIRVPTDQSDREAEERLRLIEEATVFDVKRK